MKRRNFLLSLFVFFVAAIFAVSSASNVLAAGKVKTAKDFLSEAKANIKEITPKEAKALFDKGGVIFLDVRTYKEVKKGKIPGAKHLQRGLIEFKIKNVLPDKNAKVVVYCKSGGRSALATYTLKQMGYTNVMSLKGGFKAWLKAGYPIE